MLSGLFSDWVFIHSSLHKKRAVKGIPSPKKSKSQINKQNSPRIDVCLDGTRGFGLPWSVIVGGGGVNLYFYRLGTATNVFSMEDSDSWWSQSKQEKCIPQNFIYLCFKNLSSGTSANPCFPLRRDYLFTFMLSHHLLLQAPDPRAILSFLCIMIIDVVC